MGRESEKTRKQEYVQKRQQIKFYRNWLLSVAMLPNEQLGALIKCVIGYCETGRTPDEIEKADIGSKLMFQNFKVAEDANFKKFVNQCRVNQINQAKRTKKNADIDMDSDIDIDNDI